MKKVIFIGMLISLLFASRVWAGMPILQITGSVKHDLILSVNDLYQFQSVQVRLNEVTREGEFKGVFLYRGVPLQTLLEVAQIQKKNSDFNKPVDLAIVITNKSGQKVLLSWGEIFYHNPAAIIIAYTAMPIMPHKKCQDCHRPSFYQPYLKPLKRHIGFPRLVIANDFYTDRCLEEITKIEVVDLKPKIETKRTNKLFSSQFTVVVNKKEVLKISDLSNFAHKTYKIKVVGEGKGYHGVKTFSGVPLVDILKKAGMKEGLNAAILISAPDGYRSFISAGELFLTTSGQKIIIADKCNGHPLQKDGKFILVLPDDLFADRWVKAVAKIEVIEVN